MWQILQTYVIGQMNNNCIKEAKGICKTVPQIRYSEGCCFRTDVSGTAAFLLRFVEKKTVTICHCMKRQ